MKKTYINPEVLMTTVETEILIATSPDGFNKSLNTTGGDGSKALVKEDRQDYNVWNDDWSK